MRTFFIILLFISLSLTFKALVVVEGKPITEYADQPWHCELTNGIGPLLDSLVCELRGE